MSTKDPDLMLAILGVVDEMELHEDLLWRVREDGVSFFFDCSDFFQWASADGEHIETVEDIALLRQCAVDLDSTDTDKRQYLSVYAAALYCARRRGHRPQRACFKGRNPCEWAAYPHVVALLEAAGPEMASWCTPEVIAAIQQNKASVASLQGDTNP